jgi:predicted dehydrogenase
VIFTIIGGGFGLYGYLPALMSSGNHVLLPVKYRERILDRTDLRQFETRITWVPSMEDGLSGARSVIIATQPSVQVMLVRRIVNEFHNVKELFLEKPLAQTPEIALNIYDDLLRSRKEFCIGYNFRYTEWGKKLLSTPDIRCTNGLLKIDWSFTAHHFRHNLQTWKRFHSDGGGAIRFYGIHLIALLSEIGYSKVTSSRAYGTTLDTHEKWAASFEGSNLPKCEAMVDTKSDINSFKIEYICKKNNISVTILYANLSDPFETEKSRPFESDQIDHRVPVLIQLYRSLWDTDINKYKRYETSLNLWMSVEDDTQFESSSSLNKKLDNK